MANRACVDSVSPAMCMSTACRQRHQHLRLALYRVTGTATCSRRVTGGIPKGLIGSNLYQSVALGEGYKLSKGRVRVSSSLQSNRQNTANALVLSPGSMLATRQS